MSTDILVVSKSGEGEMEIRVKRIKRGNTYGKKKRSSDERHK